MPQKPITLLMPEWSKPQWAAIAKRLAGSSITVDLEGADPEEIEERFAERLKAGHAPDVVMLPGRTRECDAEPEFVNLHTIANRLEERGLVLVRSARGEAFGAVPLWAWGWLLHATKNDPGVETVLTAACGYRDPKLPPSPICYTKLLFHEQKYRLPKKLGGFEFSIHFPGSIDLKTVTDLNNPNQGTIHILSLNGALPAGALDFLNKLPLPGPFKVDPARDAFTMQLRKPEGDRTNDGTVDFQSGAMVLNLSVRVMAPFLEPIGMSSMDMVIQERGHWDAQVGTYFIESGTVTLTGGLFNGLEILLLGASKNQTQTVQTACSAVWIPLEVQVLQYGTTPESEPELEKMRELFKRLSSSGARMASLIAAAISVSGARSVFVTYVCVKTRTLQDQQLKDGQWQNVGTPYTRNDVTATQRVELPDRDALPWWGRGGSPQASEVQAALARNAPPSGCNCP